MRRNIFLIAIVAVACLLIIGVGVMVFLWPGDKQDLVGAGTMMATIALALVTVIYVVIMKHILDSDRKRLQLSFSPILEVKLESSHLVRDHINVNPVITNSGNTPAIEVQVDAEIGFLNSTIEGNQSVPAHFRPSFISCLSQGETINKDKLHLGFGTVCTEVLKQDVCRGLKEGRKMAFSKEVRGEYWDRIESVIRFPKLRIYVYYKNHLGQFFKSFYEHSISIQESPTKRNEPPPRDSEKHWTVALPQIPQPIFSPDAIDEEVYRRELEERETRRQLGGW